MRKHLMLAGVALAALTAAPMTASIAAPSTAERVVNYHCNGIPLGPCALPPEMTRGLMRVCRNRPIGGGWDYQEPCYLIRVIRD
jgi:hypothetical protein